MVLSGFSNRGRWLSRSALGIALAAGVVAGGTLVASPALAKKAESAPKLKPSKGFVAIAGPLQKALAELAPDDPAAVAAIRTQLDQAFAAVEVEDDRYYAGTFAVNLGGKLKEPALQRRGIKAMLESGKSGADEPRYNSIAGQLAYQAGDYAEAQAYLQRAIDGGFAEDNVQALLAEAFIANNQPEKGLAMLESAILAGRTSGTLAPESWYRRGLASAYKANSIAHAAKFGQMFIEDYPASANVGMAATIVRELGNFGSQETLDLMRLMGRSNSYAEQRDYVEYIQAADPRRLPGEVLDVLNAGLAAGKLKASDPFVSDAKSQVNERIAGDKASLPAYVKDARKPGASEATVTGAADALLSYGDPGPAEELYQIALGKPGVDTQRVLTRLGIAQVDQGKYAAAQETFAKVTGMRAPIAKLWTGYAKSKAAPPAAKPAAAPVD